MQMQSWFVRLGSTFTSQSTYGSIHVYMWAKLLHIWGLAIVAGWSLHLKSSIWGSDCVCTCKWYIIWYLNWNTFLLDAEEHTKRNSGINDVTGNFAICLWMAFCFFSSLGHSVSMLSLFVLLFPKYEKNKKINDKNTEFSLFLKLLFISLFVIQSCSFRRPNSCPGVVSMHKNFFLKLEYTLTWSVVLTCGNNATGTRGNRGVNKAKPLIL